METTTPENEQQQANRRQINRSSFYILLFLFSLLFFNFSDDNVRPGKLTKAEMIKELEFEKEILNNLTFGFNLSHPLPESVLKPLEELNSIHDSHNPHFYHNISGIFRGEWNNGNITIPESMNKTVIEEARKDFNFNNSGHFTLNLKSTLTSEENINYLQGYLGISDAEHTGGSAILLANGIHFLSNGSIYLMAVPEGFSTPLDDLLHMLPNNQSLNSGKIVINEQLDKRIEEVKHEKYWDWQSSADDSSYIDDAPFICRFQFFGQLHPVPSNIKMSELLEYERELQNPQGISTIDPPPLLISSEMYSPECQLLLSSRKSKGTKIETYYSKATTFANIASFFSVVQIFALIQQMEYTPTPSSVSNVSYWTIAMQAIMDGYLCLLYLTTGVVIENVFIPFATAAFFTFVLVSIFGMKYLLVVWRIQRPESIPATTPDPTTTSDTENLLPVANVRRPNPNEETNPQRDITYLYYRLYAALLLGIFLFYQSLTRSAFVTNIIFASVGILFYSFWVPQIVRNVLRGCRHPLSHKYIILMSVTRLFVPIYFYSYPENWIRYETSHWIWAVAAYVGLQVIILFLQDAFGPRFFVPSKYLPQTYNYHPILTEDEEESEGSSKAPKDCAICMLPIDTIPPGHTSLNVLSRTNYMVTPCHHIFHTDCLEKWMRIKLECPVCRAYLPAC